MGCKEVRLLDCTLRDGGYLNDWKFGNSSITCIYDRLNEAGVDIIEIGFLDDRNVFDIDRSIQPDTESLSKVFAKTIEKRSMIVAMIDYGTCDIKNLQPKEETILDGIRVIFKKPNMHKAIAFGKQIMEKGYALFLQMVSITSYDDDDILEFANAVNELNPHAVSLVDTYGLMHKEQAFHYFELLDRYLNKEISIGYHSHNNFQLAYSNTIEVLNYKSDRSIVVDGTLYGMGKSAGNAPIELLAMYLNDNYGKNYDINQILEAINNDILPIYESTPWGYKLLFYIAAKNNCHPNYVKYLIDKKSLSIKTVDEILERIEPERKLSYNEEYIESLCIDYLLDLTDDTELAEHLSKAVGNREVLLIGPGRSSSEKKDIIRAYSEKNDPLIVAVNFIPEIEDLDYIFVSNTKRYTLMSPKLPTADVKMIATSNVTSVGRPFDYVVDYGKLITEMDNDIWDNALIILLNLLGKIHIKKVTLAGFDGFTNNVEENYVDKSFDLEKKPDYLESVNALLKNRISRYRKTMDIKFLTASLYD